MPGTPFQPVLRQLCQLLIAHIGDRQPQRAPVVNEQRVTRIAAQPFGAAPPTSGEERCILTVSRTENQARRHVAGDCGIAGAAHTDPMGRLRVEVTESPDESPVDGRTRELAREYRATVEEILELRGDDGAAVPDGETGDLYIQGPSAAMMYWGNRAKTRETFQGGWTKSGDKYIRNADGSYTYSGRSDDMLKVSGIYVSPFEVEATLVQHTSVLEAAVIGVPDGEGLTKTKAFVVLKPGAVATTDELKAFVKDKLAPYKYPRQIVFVNELPKTATGKIQRFRLREREAGHGKPA